MSIFCIDSDILMGCHLSLKIKNARAIFQGKISIFNWSFIEDRVTAWKFCFLKVNILSIVKFEERWKLHSINQQVHIHNVHSLDYIVYSASSVFVVGSSQNSLTDFEWEFVTDCSDKSIWVCNSMVRNNSKLRIQYRHSPFIILWSR